MNQIQKQPDIVSALILNGDLSKLSAQDKVRYYNGYCERLGLDPFTKPFDILRLNGKEVLYCTRSGTQQLNKLHNVSHQITNRELIEAVGVYQVTAKASLPEGRSTESIGAVNITGLKGEAYANAIMKAETKAKRRATLDLLGLGVLDESEVESIPNAQKVEEPKEKTTKKKDEKHQEAVIIEEFKNEPIEERVRKGYNNEQELLAVLAECYTKGQLNNLYTFNSKFVEDKGLRQYFTNRKTEINANAATV